MRTTLQLPARAEMYEALKARDAAYDGLFVAAIRTTGIFCRPICGARKPLEENVEFYPTVRDALFAGYRPCKRCRPLEPNGHAPVWLADLIEELQMEPTRRWRDHDLRKLGLDPGGVRRWFKKEYGMTFHAYHRAMRLGTALGRLRHGEPMTRTAYDTGYESLSGFREAFSNLVGSPPGSAGDVEPILVTRVTTPLGSMVAGATEDGLYLLEFADRRMLETQMQRLVKHTRRVIAPGSNEHIDRVQTELNQYFAGTLRDFTVPLVSPGTEFQRACWDWLRAIPFGETRTYGEEAKALGRSRAVRAVGSANGDNRISIVIPCHRVIQRSGRLAGYGGGLWRKQWLLDHERAVRSS